MKLMLHIYAPTVCQAEWNITRLNWTVIIYIIHEPSYSFMLLYHWHRITETHTFNESNGVFLNELNLSWFFGYFSKYAIRIASPESIAFAAGMLHVDWIIAICSGVNDVIIGITVDFFWQDAITPMFMVCFFCFFWTQLRLRRYYLGGVFLCFFGVIYSLDVMNFMRRGYLWLGGEFRKKETICFISNRIWKDFEPVRSITTTERKS